MAKQKVLAYLTRSQGTELELLVFKHRDFPEAGTQIPAGTVDPNEELLYAVKREVLEESGLVLTEEPKFLGSFPYLRKDNGEEQLRHVFHFQTTSNLPKQWTHVVTGSGVDQNIVLLYEWMDIKRAVTQLEVDQGLYLSSIHT